MNGTTLWTELETSRIRLHAAVCRCGDPTAAATCAQVRGYLLTVHRYPSWPGHCEIPKWRHIKKCQERYLRKLRRCAVCGVLTVVGPQSPAATWSLRKNRSHCNRMTVRRPDWKRLPVARLRGFVQRLSVHGEQMADWAAHWMIIQ